MKVAGVTNPPAASRQRNAPRRRRHEASRRSGTAPTVTTPSRRWRGGRQRRFEDGEVVVCVEQDLNAKLVNENATSVNKLL